MAATIEPIVGRYVRLPIGGREHRVYVEEAGAGVPLLCLHTAGADSRQYRSVLNDPSVLAGFRVVAFDLPWHGRSSPPAGWQHETYRLTTSAYMETVVAVIDAMGLQRPLVMGCSIGGRAVLHLAARHADVIGGVIGLQSGSHAAPFYDIDWLHRPDVHGGMVCAGAVSGLVGPLAPDAERWETLWHYMQGGPGVYKGSLGGFYYDDGDARPLLGEIDTSRCPVFLLTGEYDYSCRPEDTLEVRRQIAGAHAEVMQGLGHFPMSEDYSTFRRYLLPVLAKASTARADVVVDQGGTDE